MASNSSPYELMLRSFCGAEPWKTEHDAAMRVRDFEEFIAMGVTVFNYLQQREERAYAITPEEGLEEVDLTFARLFAEWHATATQAVAEADKFLQSGFDVDGLEELKEAIPQAAPYAEALAIAASAVAPVQLENAALVEMAKTHQPPDWWFEGEDA